MEIVIEVSKDITVFTNDVNITVFKNDANTLR